jgi:hypothetical protein
MTADQFLLIVGSGAVLAALWTIVSAYRSPIIEEVKQQAPSLEAFHDGWSDTWRDEEDLEVAALNEQYGWFELETTPMTLQALARRAANSNKAA